LGLRKRYSFCPHRWLLCFGIRNFRHLLEKHGLGSVLFEEINAHLQAQGHRLKRGTIVDASLIDAPSSTKNQSGERDPEMRQTKKGNHWYFGLETAPKQPSKNRQPASPSAI